MSEQRLGELDAVVVELADEGRTTLARAGVASGEMTTEVSLDLRHVGQGHEITVALGHGELAKHGLAALRETFDRVYEAIYGYVHRHLDLEVMTVRLREQWGALLVPRSLRVVLARAQHRGQREQPMRVTTAPTIRSRCEDRARNERRDRERAGNRASARCRLRKSFSMRLERSTR